MRLGLGLQLRLDLFLLLLHLRPTSFDQSFLHHRSHAEEKISKLERAKKGGKGRKPGRTAVPTGWIQGDFLSSTVTKEDVLDLVENGMVVENSWRLPEGELEPAPREGERVLLPTHVERGFSVPPHPFFRGFLFYFGIQLHHLPLNNVAYLSAFITLCECFLGCPPHWGLFKNIFTAWSQTMKKANPGDSRTNVIQLCGGLGIQKRNMSAYPPMTLPESVRNWQSTWFYCNDIASPNMSTSLPPFTLDRPTAPRILTIFEAEKAEVEMLAGEVISLVRNGLNGMDLLETFLSRRIQPLQVRDHAMWHYSGSEDSTWSHPEEVDQEMVSQSIKSIIGACDNPVGSKRVVPYSAENKPQKWNGQTCTLLCPTWSSLIWGRKVKAAAPRVNMLLIVKKAKMLQTIVKKKNNLLHAASRDPSNVMTQWLLQAKQSPPAVEM
ncbi:hypothetical protein D1007_21793 [Hordeum vulgare]|nr:hypothetical protein D1007_21793 [Hordeum vulgare]